MAGGKYHYPTRLVKNLVGSYSIITSIVYGNRSSSTPGPNRTAPLVTQSGFHKSISGGVKVGQLLASEREEVVPAKIGLRNLRKVLVFVGHGLGRPLCAIFCSVGNAGVFSGGPCLSKGIFYSSIIVAKDLVMDMMALSKLPEVLRLRRTLMRWRKEILNYFIYGLTNARTEGFNNVAKTVKKRSYGFRNFQNYRLRLLKACG